MFCQSRMGRINRSIKKRQANACLLYARKQLLILLNQANVDEGHGISHVDAVVAHSQRALDHEGMSLSIEIKMAVLLAAALHDADDNKFFPDNTNYENARRILQNCAGAYTILSAEYVNLVLSMISLVSCSKNRDDPLESGEPDWLLIPRYADRIEALGEIGIVRAYVYGRDNGRPLFTAETLRGITEAELRAIATPERFGRYGSQGKSESMIDHFYDKVLHLGSPRTTNWYLVSETQKRMEPIIDYCLEFGRTGVVDEKRLKRMTEKLLG